jgi:tripeptidyl-peptidase-1
MRFSTFALVGAFAGVFAAPAPAPAGHALHERRAEHLVNKWEKRDAHPAKAILPVRIGLTQRNLDRGYELLMEV